MKNHILIIAISSTFACGCASERYSTGKGDVGQFILNQAIMLGGSPTTTNGLPVISRHWKYYQDKNEHGFVIKMPRRDYSSAELFLSQAFAGQRQFGPKDGQDGARIFECRLTRKGGGIQLVRHQTEAQVIILPPLNNQQ